MIENAEKIMTRLLFQQEQDKRNFIFKLAYLAHKILTVLLTFKWISFGNFPLLTQSIRKDFI